MIFIQSQTDKRTFNFVGNSLPPENRSIKLC